MFFFGALLYGIFLGLFSHYLYCVHSKTNSSFANQHTQSYDPQKVRNAHILNTLWSLHNVVFFIASTLSVPGSRTVGMTRKWKAHENMSARSGKGGCGRKKEGSYNRPYSRYPPSLHALKDWWDKSMDNRKTFYHPWQKQCHLVFQGANKRENLPLREVALDFVYFLQTKLRFNGHAKCKFEFRKN